MKKAELMEFVNRRPEEQELYRINNICYLRHDMRHYVDGSVDKDGGDILKLEFDCLNQVRFTIYDTEIKSRDYDGIKSECHNLISKYLDEVKRQLLSDLNAGYRNKDTIGFAKI